MFRNVGGWTEPENLNALAVMVNRAQNAKWNDDTDPLETDVGLLPRTNRMLYSEGIQASALMWRNEVMTVVAVAGIQGGRDGWQFFQGGCAPVNATPCPGKINALAQGWGARLWNQWGPLLTTNSNLILLVGHSMGSCVCGYVAALIKHYQPTMPVRIVSFGSPKYCDEAFEAYIHSMSAMRVHNDADIIPYVLPNFLQSPIFTAFLDPFSFLAVNRLVHVRPGLAIKEGQRPVWREEPSGIALPIELSPNALMNATVNSDVRQHLADEYVRLLPFNPPLPLRLHNPTPPNLGPPEALARRMTLADAQREVREAQETVILPHIPADSNPDAGRIKVKRLGRAWWVLIADEPIYLATSKRDARGVATSMRRFAVQLKQRPEGFLVRDELIDRIGGFVAGSF